MAQKSRKVKTRGFVAADVEVDIITCLDRNERIYQARMQTIFKKYNRPFLNNIVVNIEDFTYMTAEGRRLWTFDANDMEDGGSKETSGKVINETEDIGVDQLVLPKKMPSARKSQGLSPRKWKSCDLPEAPISPCSKKKSSTTFDVEPLRGHTTALMEHKTNDRKKISPQNSGLSIMTKNVRIALPLNSTVSEQTKSFMDGNSEEASFSEPGNKTLGDYYPQMIENLCSLLDIEVKNQVADNIIRHYRRLILRKNILKMKMVNRSMSRSFNRTYTICPAPSSEEIATAPKTCVSTQLQEPRLSLSSELYKYDRQAHVDFQNNASILDSQTIYQDNPIQSQQQKDMNGARSLRYSSRTSSPSLCISPSKSITNKSHMDGAIAQSPHRKDSKHLQQNLNSLSIRNLISGIPMLHSPKQMAANPNCNMGEESKSPRKSMTSDSQREVDRYFASYKDPIEPSPERTSTLTRRNSFSFFGHSKNGNFESLYRNLTINGPQPVNSAQIELSKTAYSSLGSSPGSLRAKRLLSHESLVSTSKRPRSVISSSSSSFSMDCSDPFGLEPSSSRAQQHSAAASALPPYMSPNSPGSHRSSSPRFNGRSPKRTSACVHRKLIYQED